MQKKVTAALVLFSIAILAVGLWNYVTLFLLPAKSSWEARVGTGDPFFSLLGAVGAVLGFVIVMRHYLGAVLLLWAVYGGGLLALRLHRGIRRRREQGSPAGPLDFSRKTK